MQSLPIKMLIYIGACWPSNRSQNFPIRLRFWFARAFSAGGSGRREGRARKGADVAACCEHHAHLRGYSAATPRPSCSGALPDTAAPHRKTVVTVAQSASSPWMQGEEKNPVLFSSAALPAPAALPASTRDLNLPAVAGLRAGGAAF